MLAYVCPVINFGGGLSDEEREKRWQGRLKQWESLGSQEQLRRYDELNARYINASALAWTLGMAAGVFVASFLMHHFVP